MAKTDYARELGDLFGPGALSKDTLSLYNFLLGSPQFQQLLSQNALTGQQFSSNLTQGLAQRGLTTSGVGTMAGAAGRSAVATGEQALRGGLFGTAAQTALQSLMARLQEYGAMRQTQAAKPSALAGLAGSVLGAAGTALTGPLGMSLFGPKMAGGLTQPGLGISGGTPFGLPFWSQSRG